MQKDAFTVVSLFSGGMGLDIGLEKIGRFNLLACVEKVPAFCETIRRNRDAGRLGNRKLKVYQQDIAQLDTDEEMRYLHREPVERETRALTLRDCAPVPEFPGEGSP